MKIKKVLLIVPPAFTFKTVRDINPLPPMGLGYLASVLEKNDIKVKILDCLIHGWNNEEKVNDKIIRVGLSDRDIEERIRDFDPDIVGVNCQFSRQYKIYHHMFSLAKKVNQHCIVIAGGAHTTVCPEEVLNDPNCDYVLVGEAEESLKDLVLALNGDVDLSQIDGLGWKSNGKININEKTKWVTDLDVIPFPAYHLMEIGKYFGLDVSHGERYKDRFSPIITSRGCPAKCIFCSANKVWGNKYRMRSVKNVLEEMRLLKDQYGIEEIMFEDDNVTANPKRAKKLFRQMVVENFNFVWSTPNGVGVWSMDEEMINLMKESGCISLNFPVESGSQRILDNVIKKPLILPRVKELIQYCRKIKLDHSMFLVVGLPGETLEDIWKSFRFAASCECYSPHISVATPYPGTKLFDECLGKNFFSKKFHLEDLFIKSFMIKTYDWSDVKLRRTLLLGKIYLKCCELKKHPIKVLKWSVQKLLNIKYYVSYINIIIRDRNNT